MDSSSNNRLEYRHIEHPTKEALKYIDSRVKELSNLYKLDGKNLIEHVMGALNQA